MVHVQKADLVLIFFKIKVFMLSALDQNASFLALIALKGLWLRDVSKEVSG